MTNKLCPFCGGEAKPLKNYRMSGVCVGCEHSIENPHPAIQCLCCGGVMMGSAEHWDRRFVCLDKNGDKVFAGDEAETASCKGIVNRLNGIVIECEDGHLRHVWPHELILVKEDA
ncbi:hypothetical protein LCGC14_1606870 [marine sediment metagenome]|uniref:Uncharacterized protein n=1 Tax=marine sediment metagenome TaxID=412755 RepID=A0A0F9KQC0_9ZZZZ